MRAIVDGKIIDLAKVRQEDNFIFINLLKSLGKYARRAYKQFLFASEYELKSIKDNEYYIELPTDSKFKALYGTIKVIVELNDTEMILKRIEPYTLLKEGHDRLLNTYKGLPILGQKEIDKINILERLGKF